MKTHILRSTVGRLRPNFGLLALFAVIACVAVVLPAHGMLIGIGLSTLSATNPTLLDMAKTWGPDGVTMDITEILNENNEIVQDMAVVEGNLPTGHRTTIATSLPAPTWRKFYGGVAPTKGSNVQVTDTCGMLEAFGQVDVALADLNGNTMKFRASEDRKHIEGMAQQLAATLIYGNETTQPEAFTGLAPRFSTVTVATSESADNVIDGLGTGSDNTSIWLVNWGQETVHGIIPKGSKAGLQNEDMGKVLIQNSDGSKYLAYVTHYRQDLGLTVRDWRHVVRICNVDVSDLTTTTAQKALITYMIQASERIPAGVSGRPAFYMARRVREALRLGIIEKIAPATLTAETVAGRPVIMFDGVPVRRVDQILLTEARIV